MNDDVIDIVEVAAFLKIGLKTAYKLVKAKKIPHRRVGKQLRFSRSGLEAWIGVPEKKAS